MIKYWKVEAENPTITEIFYEWIHRKVEDQDICQGTFNRYENDFKRYFEDDSSLADAKIRDIKSEEIIPFLRRAIVKYALTAKAYSKLRTLTYGIFKYAKVKKRY